VRVNLDEAPAEAQRFQVRAIPLIVLLRPDGSEIARYTGYRSPEDLLALLDKAERATPDSTAK
jgi:thioredoxin-like negative regulator of GroEL